VTDHFAIPFCHFAVPIGALCNSFLPLCSSHLCTLQFLNPFDQEIVFREKLQNKSKNPVLEIHILNYHQSPYSRHSLALPVITNASAPSNGKRYVRRPIFSTRCFITPSKTTYPAPSPSYARSLQTQHACSPTRPFLQELRPAT